MLQFKIKISPSDAYMDQDDILQIPNHLHQDTKSGNAVHRPAKMCGPVQKNRSMEYCAQSEELIWPVPSSKNKLLGFLAWSQVPRFWCSWLASEYNFFYGCSMRAQSWTFKNSGFNHVSCLLVAEKNTATKCIHQRLQPCYCSEVEFVSDISWMPQMPLVWGGGLTCTAIRLAMVEHWDTLLQIISVPEWRSLHDFPKLK